MSHSAAPQPITARRSAPLRGTVEIPGDKSISHRALMFGAMARGETHVTGLLEGEDVQATAAAMRAFGATLERVGPGEWRVQGVGIGGFAEPDQVIDCGNSGTSVRLIMGAMASTPITATFTGDASLCRRPMGRITDPLALFGAEAHGRAGGLLPLTLHGAPNAAGVDYTTPMPSAQVKSAVLLAGLNARGETVVRETHATRDHSERMLRGFGATLEVESDGPARIIRLAGEATLTGQRLAVPRDPSSAAFPLAAALMVEGSEISLPGIGMNPTRTGLFDTLREMGADLTITGQREEGGEPVADLTARFGPLKGIEVPPERAPSMIDEYPILAALAATAEGRTVMAGIGELRVKESDRIAAMANGLRAAGVTVEETEDSLTIEGRGADGVIGGATAATHLDHRIAMSFLCLGLTARKGMGVDDASPIATSFPGFMPMMKQLGASMLRRNAG